MMKTDSSSSLRSLLLVRRCLPAAMGLALFLFTGLAVHAPAAEKRTALVMGVADYKGAPGLGNLRGVNVDLQAMSSKLRELGFQVTVCKDPTLGQAMKAVDDFGKSLASRGGIGLFYFSGHGAEREGSNFLLPSAARITSGYDLADQALNAQRVLSRMEESKTKVNLVFLDCCRNEFSRSAGASLAPMQAEGVFVGFATADDTAALDSSEGGIYTRALIKHMSNPTLSITDMHTLVTKDVKAVAPDQNPFQYSGLDTIFRLGAVDESAAVPEPEWIEQEPVAPPVQASRSEIKHQELKQAVGRRSTNKDSNVYLAVYDGKGGLVALQFLEDDHVNGALFIPEDGMEIRLYGHNFAQGKIRISLWESGNPLDGGQLEKVRGPKGEIRWQGKLESGRELVFERDPGRRISPAQSRYQGTVGTSPVNVTLNWQRDGRVSGEYRSSATGNTYRLAGSNALEGFVYLDEFTRGKLSARLLLAKDRSTGRIRWTGTLYNVDGPRRSVSFSKR